MLPSEYTHPLQPAHPQLAGYQLKPVKAPKADLLLYVLALMTLSYVWRIHSVIPVLGTLKFALLIGAAAVAVFLSDPHPVRKIRRIKTPLLSLLLALLAVTIASVPGAIYAGKSATYLGTEIVPNVVFAILLASAVRSTRDVEWLMKAHVLGAFGFALLTFLFRDGERLGGYAYYDANDFALMLVCTLPFLIYFMRRGVRGWFRLFALVSFGLFVFLIMKTGSRGGFLGLLAVMTYVVLRYRAIPARTRLNAVIGACALLLVAGNEAYWTNIRTLLNPKEDYNWSGNSPTGRMEVWKRGIGYMVANPFLGVGVRNFPQAEGRSEIARRRMAAGAGWKWSVAHNAFVEVGAELGVIGLGLFIAIFVSALRSLKARRPRAPNDAGADGQESAMRQTLIAALVGFVACSFFVSAQYFSVMYLLLGLVIGLVKLERLRPPQPNSGPVRPGMFLNGLPQVPAFDAPRVG